MILRGSGNLYCPFILPFEIASGDIFITGNTESFQKHKNFWVIRLGDNDGDGFKNDVVWQKHYGGDAWDAAYTVINTNDNNLLLSGITNSYGSGSFDIWVLKMDLDGNLIWQKVYGAAGDDRANSAMEIDGEFYIAGQAKSFSGDNTEDIWALKLAGDGSLIWQKRFFGTGLDRVAEIVFISADRIMLAGYTESFGVGLRDAWLIGFDGSGTCLPVSEETSVTETNTNAMEFVTWASTVTSAITTSVPVFTSTDVTFIAERQAP